MSSNISRSNDNLILYGTQLSSYTAKVRSFLINTNTHFEERVPNQKTYKNLIEPRTGAQFLPVIKTPDNDVIQDSSTIIETISKEKPEHSIYPSTPKQRLAALLLEVYADEWLYMFGMHFRWNYPKTNENYLLQEYGKILKPNWPLMVQQSASKKVLKSFPDKLINLGINNKTSSAIEKSFLQLILILNKYFRKYVYLLGSQPSIADFSLYGQMYAFFHNDPYAKSFMVKKAPYINIWINRMSNKKITDGHYYTNDVLPKAINELLQKMSIEQVPVLLETAHALEKWNAKNKYQDLPETLGQHNFNFNGINSKREVLPYSLWMWQKPYKFYHSLNDEIKFKINPWLKRIGMLDALNTPLNLKLKKINSHLLIAVD